MVGSILLVLLLLIVVVVVVLGLWFMVTYNGLVSLRQAVKNAWAQIDVQLKRRHDLIPNLVNTVKGYAAHEKETCERVVNARAKATSVTLPAEVMKAEGELTAALSRLLAVSEAYPELKANQNFIALQEELTSTENRISFARQHYNDSVAVYNMGLQVFPNNMMAAPMGFQPMDFFQTDQPGEREVPQVKF